MPLRARVASFWRNLTRRAHVEQDLDDELRAVLDALTADKIRAGMTTGEAGRAALIELGGVESVKEQVRAVRTGAALDTIWLDLRFALRLLARNPLFALTAAASLAIGIGATTAIFTVANGLLLRAAEGVADPGSLVDIVRRERSFDPGVEEISYPDYQNIRDRVATLENVYAYQLILNPASLRVDEGAERVFPNAVSIGLQAADGSCWHILPRSVEWLWVTPIRRSLSRRGSISAVTLARRERRRGDEHRQLIAILINEVLWRHTSGGMSRSVRKRREVSPISLSDTSAAEERTSAGRQKS